MATRHLLRDLADRAAGAGLTRLEIESVGGVDAARRVSAGEGFDLVFLAADALAGLAAGGHVDAASVTSVAVSQVAVAVADATAGPARGTAVPAYADAVGVRHALRSAVRIGYSTGPSGTALVEMIRRWGLSGEISDRLVQARTGVPVAQLLADGEVDLGFQQLSELVGQPGIRILGVLPRECAIDTVFAGAVAATAPMPEAARELLRFFSSERVASAIRSHSFDLPAQRSGGGRE
ncbi:substrate-binding domain-containing protein [Microbacterium sp. RU33B]|uniref:molybdate ABC transporter substrate-binding protein n=1 Tax=Microbacterium sp. RU33B TaxID=1907390 RepID=UPI0009FB503E|nr:substrate-binding domain-containing protein [Microbacterium sp. RU33B]